MSNQSNGVPAFPLHPDMLPNHECAGMTLRDYFAVKALAALIGHEGKDGDNRGAAGVPKLAKFAYEYADAMLAAREAL